MSLRSDQVAHPRGKDTYALSGICPTSHILAVSHDGASTTGEGRTAREWDVGRLLAQGFTNRQIAAALAIRERTVGTHVEHIFKRLDFRARAQAAVWVAEHDPLLAINRSPPD